MTTACHSRWLLVPVFGLAFFCFWPTDVSAQTIDNRETTLEQRLITGLQVRRPSEFAFIDAVIDTVNRGELPERLVDRFLFWARNKAPKGRGTYRPIIYFQPALSIQAAKLRITIQSDPPTSS